MSSLRRLIAVAVFLVPSLFLLATGAGSQSGTPRRVTHTTPETLNLNPSISGDGRRVAFESSADVAAAGSGGGFRLVAADTSAGGAFKELALSRAPSPALSQDGTRAVFAAREDPLGLNPDGDSEIFLHDGARLRQLTRTVSDTPAQRASQGCFRPSISDDGRFVAFTSDRDLTGSNAEHNREVFLLDTQSGDLRQLSEEGAGLGARDAKISGDGSRIAYARDRPADGGGSVSDLLVYSNVSGETFAAATGLRGLALSYGRAVSDDGLRVIYAAQGANGATQVFLLDGRNDYVRRQLTQLGTRSADVPLHPTVSGDGNRVAFATRRSVTGGNADSGVELYLHDM